MPDYVVFIFRFCLFALFHSLFAVPALKQRLSGSTGTPGRYRFIYNICSLAMFGWVMAAYHHSPVLYYAPGNWGLIMYLVQLVILFTMATCLKQTGIAEFLGLHKKSTALTPENLVTTGCYSVVRHPLYVLAILFMASTPVMSGQWLLLTLLSTAYFLLGACIEEQRLLREHGTAYQRYREQVPFMIPRGKKLRQPPAASA